MFDSDYYAVTKDAPVQHIFPRVASQTTRRHPAQVLAKSSLKSTLHLVKRIPYLFILLQPTEGGEILIVQPLPPRFFCLVAARYASLTSMS